MIKRLIKIFSFYVDEYSNPDIEEDEIDPEAFDLALSLLNTLKIWEDE